jgi:hypothetical protein
VPSALANAPMVLPSTLPLPKPSWQAHSPSSLLAPFWFNNWTRKSAKRKADPTWSLLSSKIVDHKSGEAKDQSDIYKYFLCNDRKRYQSLDLIHSSLHVHATWNPQIWTRAYMAVATNRNDSVIILAVMKHASIYLIFCGNFVPHNALLKLHSDLSMVSSSREHLTVYLSSMAVHCRVRTVVMYFVWVWRVGVMLMCPPKLYTQHQVHNPVANCNHAYRISLQFWSTNS